MQSICQSCKQQKRVMRCGYCGICAVANDKLPATAADRIIYVKARKELAEKAKLVFKGNK